MSYNAPFTCLKFIPLLVFLLILQSVSAQDFKALDDLTAQYQKEYNNNVVVMVWKDSILYQKSTHQDVTNNTQAPIGCTSAWLTAALVMTFVEQGKLKLD